jgi:tRNA(adenine34) deaminase
MFKGSDEAQGDERWMREALVEAKSAEAEDEVPIGCVIVWKDRVIGRGHNRVEALQDPTAHAEIIAIGAAAGFLKSRRLAECTMYVNVEPCAMCAGAIVLSRIERLAYGARDPKAGACGSVVNIVEERRLNHQVKVSSGVLEDECGRIVTEYFKRKRTEI